MLFVSDFKFLYLRRTMEAEWREYECAYCGEHNETFIDPAPGQKQSYVEDCGVCCRPNVLTVRIDTENDVATIEAAIEE